MRIRKGYGLPTGVPYIDRDELYIDTQGKKLYIDNGGSPVYLGSEEVLVRDVVPSGSIGSSFAIVKAKEVILNEGDVLDLYVRFAKVGFVENGFLEVYLNPTESLAGAVKVGNFIPQQGANRQYLADNSFFQKVYCVSNASVNVQSFLSSYDAMGYGYAMQTIEVDLTVPQYVLIACNTDGGTELIEVVEFTLKRLVTV